MEARVAEARAAWTGVVKARVGKARAAGEAMGLATRVVVEARAAWTGVVAAAG